MENLFFGISGLGIGAIFVYFIMKSKIDFLTEMHTQRVHDLQITDVKLKESFVAMAVDVLDKNTERLKESAKKDLKQIETEGAAEIEKKKVAIETTITDLKKDLKSTTEKVAQFEKERTEQYSKLGLQLQSMGVQEQRLIIETEKLKTALTTSSSVRGRWGELVLRNILNKSELVAGIDFSEQETSASEDGAQLRPDFVINLPHSQQHLVIDAKTSLYESYLESEKSETEQDRQQLHRDFVKKLRSRVMELTSKEYQKHVSNSAPYVIMFIPGEAAIRAAFDADTELFQWAIEKKVFITSPVTIIPLILLVANSKQQFRLSEKAFELSQVIEQVGSRLVTFVERLNRVQKGLDSATRAWNEAVEKSWFGQQGVPKALEKAKELGGQLSLVPEVSTVTVSPRPLLPDQITSPEDTDT